MCVKVEKIKDLHQSLENVKGGWFYAECLKLSKKLHENKFKKICRFFLHYFHARARPRDFKGLSQVSACFYVFTSFYLSRRVPKRTTEKKYILLHRSSGFTSNHRFIEFIYIYIYIYIYIAV